MIVSAFRNLSSGKGVIKHLLRNAVESIRVTPMRTLAEDEMLSYFDALIHHEQCRQSCSLRDQIFDEGPVLKDALRREVI